MDKAQKLTNKKLKQMERHLKSVYSRSHYELSKKWIEFLDTAPQKVLDAEKAYKEAKEIGDKDLIRKTGIAHKKALNEFTYQNDFYFDMLNRLSKDMTEVNQRAIAYLNGEVPKIYSINYSETQKDIGKAVPSYTFDLMDEDTARILMLGDAEYMDYFKEVVTDKDIRWNKKVLNSQMTQGILQGESIEKLAKRIMNVTDALQSTAIREARTMTTGVENLGRMQSYKRAESMGIRLKKEWLATRGNRTREWHAELDGQTKAIDEPFENEYGKIMFPGDPSAHPANIYNCRCTLIADIEE